MSRLLLLASLTLLLAPAQEPAAPPLPPEPYPPLRHPTRVLCFSTGDGIKTEALRKALSDLSTPQAQCRVVAGPLSAAARPGKRFLAIEAPASASARDVLKALRKGAPQVELLATTAFEGPAHDLGSGAAGLGLTQRDLVLGMSGDVRWIDCRGGWTQLHHLPGKLTPEALADRWRKLGEPLGWAPIGELVREALSWELALPLDVAAAKRAEKAIAKLDGVTAARLDARNGALTVQFELAGLEASLGPWPLPGGEPGAGAWSEGQPLRLRFDSNQVLDLLEREQLALAPPAPVKPAEPEGK